MMPRHGRGCSVTPRRYSNPSNSREPAEAAVKNAQAGDNHKTHRRVAWVVNHGGCTASLHACKKGCGGLCHGSYQRVKGRRHSVEERISTHSQNPPYQTDPQNPRHATSQPSQLHRTHSQRHCTTNTATGPCLASYECRWWRCWFLTCGEADMPWHRRSHLTQKATCCQTQRIQRIKRIQCRRPVLGRCGSHDT